VDNAKPEDSVPFDNKILNEVIAQHFFRQGRFDIGEMFVQVYLPFSI
jgi:hypothetical protein